MLYFVISYPLVVHGLCQEKTPLNNNELELMKDIEAQKLCTILKKRVNVAP